MRIFLALAVCAPFITATTVHADVVWPALFVAQGFLQFWYVVIVSVVLEAWVFRHVMHATWQRAFVVTGVCNACSFIIGTVLSAIGMLGWHFIADGFLGGTFNLINWIVTFLLMCGLSIVIELWAAHLFFGYRFKQVLLPLFIGNLLSYAFIASYLIFEKLPDL